MESAIGKHFQHDLESEDCGEEVVKVAKDSAQVSKVVFSSRGCWNSSEVLLEWKPHVTNLKFAGMDKKESRDVLSAADSQKGETSVSSFLFV